MNKRIYLKQWGLAIGAGVIFLGAAAALIAITREETASPVKETKPVEVKLSDRHLPEDHFVATFGAQMLALKEDLATLQKEIQNQKEAGSRVQNRSRTGIDPRYQEESEVALAPYELRGEIPPSNVKPINPQSILVIKNVAKPTLNKKEVTPNVFTNATQGTEGETLLITGAFARARLFNGVEAPTGGQANGNPVPLLMELTDKAVLPNKFKSDIKRCFVTANATGDLSSERVLVRLDRLSCLTRDGKPIDVKVTGYVAGEDGKTGLKARVVTRSGQAIANALLLGTLAGLGEAVSIASQDTTTHAMGTITSTVDNPWRAGIGAGLEDAFSRVADYYLKLADKIFPVLEVDAGRTVEIVVTQSASLVTQ